MSRIFFTVRTVNQDGAPDRNGEPCIAAQIYSDDGRMIAEHLMSVEGARIRITDFQAATEDAESGERDNAPTAILRGWDYVHGR